MSNCDTCTEPGFWRKAWSFIRAIFSKRNKALGKERFYVCNTYNRNEKGTYRCEYMIVKKDKSFCDLCGCPQSGPLAYFSDLKFKTTLTKAQCPENRW